MNESGFWDLLGDSEREALMAAARSRVFQDNAVLCLEGEPSTHVFILLSGWVKVSSVTREGREILEALRGQGDVVGEIAGQVTGYRTATIRALRTVRTLIVGADQFEIFLNTYSGAARAYRRMIAERQRAAHESQRSKMLFSGPQRLASLLLDFAEQQGELTGKGLIPALPLSQEELACLIGSSRSTVTRALRDWRSRRIIITHQHHITVLDQDMLRRIAGRLEGQ